MKATDFEIYHQTLVHQLIVGAAALTYLFDPDDVVWRLVKNSAAPHMLERFLFIVATIFVAVGAAMSTSGRTVLAENGSGRDRRRWLGDFCYSIGLASLLPPSGFAVLVGGEGLRVLRLLRGSSDEIQNVSYENGRERGSQWVTALRREAVKLGILVTMIVFVITLRDRYADVLVGLSFLTGLLLNLPRRPGSSD